LRAWRQVETGKALAVPEGDGDRPKPGRLLGQEVGVRSGREGNDGEGVGIRFEDLHGLSADRSGRPQEGDPARRAVPSPHSVSG
jgi:hypothetical protein